MIYCNKIKSLHVFRFVMRTVFTTFALQQSCNNINAITL